MTHRIEKIQVRGNPMEVFLFTPAGEHMRLGAAFSAATYFFEPLGALASSAAALLCVLDRPAPRTVRVPLDHE